MHSFFSFAVSRVTVLAAAAVVCLVFFILAANPTNWVKPFPLAATSPDEAIYISLADSLREKGNYYFNQSPHTRFPPGLPLLFAFAGSLFGAERGVYQSIITLSFVFSLAAVYYLIKKQEGGLPALIATGLFATSPYLFHLATDYVNSDVPYVCATLAALIAFELLREEKRDRYRLVFALVLGFFLIASIVLRSVGLALLGAFWVWTAYFLVRRRETKIYGLLLPSLFGATVVQLTWIYWAKTMQTRYWDGEFMDNYFLQIVLLDPHRPDLGFAGLSDFLLRMLNNLIIQAAHIAELITRLSWVNPLWSSPLVMLLLVISGLGFWESVRRRLSVTDLYFVFYTLIFLLWPYDEHERFVVPVFPIIFLYLWRGATRLAAAAEKDPERTMIYTGAASLGVGLFAFADLQTPVSRSALAACLFWLGLASFLLQPAGRSLLHSRQWLRPVKGIVAAGFAVLLLAGFAQQVKKGRDALHFNVQTARHYPSYEAALWLKENTGEEDVPMGEEYPLLFAVTGRKTIPLPITRRVSEIEKTIRENQVKYIVLVKDASFPYFYPTQDERLELLRHAMTDRLETVRTTVSYEILRVKSS